MEWLTGFLVAHSEWRCDIIFVRKALQFLRFFRPFGIYKL